MSRLKPDERERVIDGDLRLKAFEGLTSPDRLTPAEGYAYSLFERLSPFRGSSFEGPGPIPWLSVQDLLDREGIRAPDRREFYERVLALMDVTYRNEAAKSSQERMSKASSRPHRRAPRRG